MTPVDITKFDPDGGGGGGGSVNDGIPPPPFGAAPPPGPNDPPPTEPPPTPTTDDWPPPTPPAPRDPLVLDLNGDGISLISLAASTAHFDFNGDGFAERTGWLGSTDGFLIRDSNGNGIVDGVGELFGNAAVDGFTALQALDTNSDNQISSTDAAFGQLRVWRDLNGDGTSQAGEVVSLASLGITSLGLTHATSGQVIGGNTVNFTGSFTTSSGPGRLTA